MTASLRGLADSTGGSSARLEPFDISFPSA